MTHGETAKKCNRARSVSKKQIERSFACTSGAGCYRAASPRTHTYIATYSGVLEKHNNLFTSTNFQTFNFELVFSEFYFCIFVPRENDTDEHDTSLATQVRR
jgi:hypothetical protein